MNNHKRGRNRPRETGRSHPATRRPTGQQNSVSASQTLRGLYSHPRCCHAVSVMTGCVVQLRVKKGTVFEGILGTVSAEYDVVLEAAHVVEKKSAEVTPTIPNEIIEKLVFHFKDIIYLKAKDCDIEFAAKGESFLTDTEISDTGRGVNGQLVEKELEEWTGDAEDVKVDHSLESAGGDMANGWSAEDMFKTNEEKYGVQTVYDDKLSDYTTPLSKDDTKEFRDRKDRAERLAREIEASPDHARNAGLESSDGTEEEKYSSVVRPGYAGHGPNSNKYVPPHLRPPHSGGSNHGNNPGNQPPRLRSPQNRQMHNATHMGRPQTRTPPQAHSPQPPPHQVHPPPHHMMPQGHPMRHSHPHHPHPHPHPHHPHPPHPSQLQLQRAPNQGPPPQHISPQQQRLPPPHHIPHPMTNPRSPQQDMAQQHLRAPPQTLQPQLPQQQISPRQPPPPIQDHRGSPVSPNQLRNSTADVIREEKQPYVDVSDSSKNSNSINSRKPPSSPQTAVSADGSIPTSTGAPTPAGTDGLPKVDKNVAELKEFQRNFQLSESKPASASEPKAAPVPASKVSPNSIATTTTTATSAQGQTTTTSSTDKTRTATEALEKKESEPDKSESKKSVLNPNAKEFNPNAKPFVPQNKTVLVQPTKTPTPPRPQSQPSPVLMAGPHGPMPIYIAPGTMVSQQMNPNNRQYVKKTASNIPNQRPHQPNDMHGIPVSMTAGHAAGPPIITSFQQHGQLMYQVQQGGQVPQGMTQQIIPQPQPYQQQPYQPPLPYTKQPAMYRQVTPQANIPNAAQHQGAQGIQQVQEGNHHQVHVVSNPAALQQAQHQAAAVAMQQAQQQQQQQQQQQHFTHQQMQQHQQHQQPAPHLQAQGHPHAQPNSTPPQQQGQHSQQGQPGGPTAMQAQQQQQGQAPQHTGRPSPSPVHHLPQQITHMTQAQMQQHPHVSQQPQLLYQPSLQPVTSQPVPGQQLQSPQTLHPQHPFGGGHPQLQLHYPPTSNIQAANITSVTPVHSHPHPHPQQAGVFYIQNPNQAGPAGGGQGGMQYPAVSGAGQHMTGPPYMQAAQGPGQHQQAVQYQQGN